MKPRLARELALQSLYQMRLNDVTAGEAADTAIREAEQENEANLNVGDGRLSRDAVLALVEGTLRHQAEIDELLSGYLKGWKLDRLSKVDREILRLAVFEMIYREDVPPKVVVNEAIELAKQFGSEESGKFVNGVLGQMIRELDEIKSAMGGR